MNILSVLIGWGVAAPVAVYMWLSFIIHPLDIYEVRKEEVAKCDVRIKETINHIKGKINEDAKEKIADGRKAADAVVSLPDDLVRLCQKSASCRDRR